jgi:energy-coupling factor transporter ATP-binding protein EcfA2
MGMGDVSDEKPPARLLEVTIGDWPGLGGDVRLELSGQRTVLVGKNGSGKSLVLTGLVSAVREPWLRIAQRSSLAPRSFRCAIRTESEQTIWFEYRWSPSNEEPAFEETGPELGLVDDQRFVGTRRSWFERCWRADGTLVWKVDDGAVTFDETGHAVIGSGVSLLSGHAEHHAGMRLSDDELPAERKALSRALGGATIVPAGVPRSGEARRGEVLLRGWANRSGARVWGTLSLGRVETLARRLATLWESRRESYDEFEGLALRLGLVREGVRMKIYEDPQKELRQEARRDLADILFDGVNIGLLSDGTLRAAEVLVELVQPWGPLLLIEEPETAVHPGLVRKLLAELDAYTIDRQLVVSTHSALVVDWCERQPGAVRLVERDANRTTIRSLTPEEVGRVASYLNDEGTLSEFVYHQVAP